MPQSFIIETDQDTTVHVELLFCLHQEDQKNTGFESLQFQLCAR